MCFSTRSTNQLYFPLMIFHSLNESTIFSCYQTHILSEDGELPLKIFHSLNESTTSTCYQTLQDHHRQYCTACCGNLGMLFTHTTHNTQHLLRIFYSLNESSTSSCYHLVAIISRHIPYTLHARCVLDQETQNVHSLNEGSPQTVLHSLLWQSGHVVHTKTQTHTHHTTHICCQSTVYSLVPPFPLAVNSSV